MKIGKNIKAARQKAGFSQLGLAEACGWGSVQNRISNYENDVREPALNDLNKIAEITGVSLLELVGLEQDNSDAAKVFKLLSPETPERQAVALQIIKSYLQSPS